MILYLFYQVIQFSLYFEGQPSLLVLENRYALFMTEILISGCDCSYLFFECMERACKFITSTYKSFFHDRSRRHLVYLFNHDSAFLTLFHVNTWHLERIYLNLKLFYFCLM